MLDAYAPVTNLCFLQGRIINTTGLSYMDVPRVAHFAESLDIVII